MRTREGTERISEKLRRELGEEIMSALNDPDTFEITCNDDGCVWVERAGEPYKVLTRLTPVQALSIVGTVADALDVVANADSPIVSGELPIDGSRFMGLVPPVVTSASFTIRKKAISVFGLDDYQTKGILGSTQVSIIKSAVREKKNIVICGGTGSGKTTLANAIIAEITNSSPGDRIVLIEDTLEIQCVSQNKVSLRANLVASMNDLLAASMRLRPDRIIVGEVRGAEALTLLKAWNTGHPGGVATVHANSAEAALVRLEQLVAEGSATPMRAVIGEAVDLIISIQKTNSDAGRAVHEILIVDGCDGDKYQFRKVTAQQIEDIQDAA